jgi:hypothetical protein
MSLIVRHAHLLPLADGDVTLIEYGHAAAQRTQFAHSSSQLFTSAQDIPLTSTGYYFVCRTKLWHAILPCLQIGSEWLTLSVQVQSVEQL